MRGELSPELRQQGLDLVRRVREELERVSPEGARRPRTSSDRLEAGIYGMWLWSDRAEASSAMQGLSESTRFRVLCGYLNTLARRRFHMWSLY